MATGPLWPPFPVPVLTGRPEVLSPPWVLFIQQLLEQAGSGGGGVSAVGATAPLSSTGGSTPVISIANSGVTLGTYGDSTHVAQFTVTAKGLITAASNVAISGAGGSSWIPLALGTEPLMFVSDGAGHPILVAYP